MILQNRIELIDKVINSSIYDYQEIKKLKSIDFEDIQTRRLINSFLFTFSKLQDLIGAKLFKEVLYELKEIENKHTPMIDVLYKLEQLNMIENALEWDILREIRNELTHEYELSYENKIENLNLKKAIWGYEEIIKIYRNIKNYLIEKKLIKEKL